MPVGCPPAVTPLAPRLTGVFARSYPVRGQGYSDADTGSRARLAAYSMLLVHRCFPITPPTRS